MAALDFPASPTNGQVYQNWVYSTSKGAWQSLPLTGPKTITADVPPSNPQDGDQWFNTVDGTLYVYVVDIDGGQWVESQAPITANGYYSPNYVINGAFDIWQRGASMNALGSGATNFYSADRWESYRAGYAAGMSAYRVDSDLLGFRYFARVFRDNGNTGTQALYFNNPFETSMIAPLRGKTVTASFYVRKGENYSASGNVLVFQVDSGTGTESGTRNGFTSQVTVATQNITLTSSWQRVTNTFVVPINSTQFALRFIHNTVGTAGTFDCFDITGVQLEEGAIATTFRRNANSMQGELAACQRYYSRISGDGVYAAYATGTVSGYAGGTYAYFPITLPVQMRSTPASIDTSAAATFLVSDGVNSGTCTAVPTIATGNSSKNVAWISSTNGALTTYRTAFLQANNTSSSYIGFSAEL